MLSNLSWNHDYFCFRNIFRVCQSCWIVGLAKLIQTEWLFKIIYQVPSQTEIREDLSSAEGLPITCQILCTALAFSSLTTGLGSVTV